MYRFLDEMLKGLLLRPVSASEGAEFLLSLSLVFSDEDASSPCFSYLMKVSSNISAVLLKHIHFIAVFLGRSSLTQDISISYFRNRLQQELLAVSADPDARMGLLNGLKLKLQILH